MFAYARLCIFARIVLWILGIAHLEGAAAQCCLVDIPGRWKVFAKSTHRH